MFRRRLLATPFLCTAAAAQPVRIVDPFPAGSPDAMARFLADRLAPRFGQQVLVESRSGARRTIGAEFVAHAPADVHVLGISQAAPMRHLDSIGMAAAEGARCWPVTRAAGLRAA